MSRIFVRGDTHGSLNGDMTNLHSKKWKEGKTLTKNDYLIVVGDFGLFWYEPGSFNFKKSDLPAQRWLTEKKWTTLFCDGNHENFDLVDQFEEIEMFGGKVGKFNDSIYHLKRGEIYEIHGKKFFVMGGARSHDIDSRTEGKNWWAREMPSEEEKAHGLANLDKHGWKVDYVLTHTCPNFVADAYVDHLKEQIDRLKQKESPSWSEMKRINEWTFDGWEEYYSHKSKDPLGDYLENIAKKLEYKRWYFGHWHDNWIYEKYRMLYCLIEEIK